MRWAWRPIGVWQRSCHEFFFNTPALTELGLLDRDFAAEVERSLAAGHRGIKLHPRAESFRLDNSGLLTIAVVSVAWWLGGRELTTRPEASNTGEFVHHVGRNLQDIEEKRNTDQPCKKTAQEGAALE